MTGSSPIVRIIARFAVPLTFLVAVQIFFQGHDNPGGGFIGQVVPCRPSERSRHSRACRNPPFETR